MRCVINSLFDFKRDHINLSSLCIYCGISRQGFYNIINNKYIPNLEIAFKITDYLNTSLMEIGYSNAIYDISDLWVQD